MNENLKNYEKEIENLRKTILKNEQSSLNFEEKNGVKILISTFKDKTIQDLKTMVDEIKAKEENVILVLALKNQDSINFVAGVSKSLTSKIKAGDIIKELSLSTGGKGGGRPDFAQGGGKEFEKLDKALENIKKYIETLV